VSPLGKTPLSKKAHEKTHVHRAKFNGRPKLPGWPGKRWRSPESGRGVAFIEGDGKEVSSCAVVSGRGEDVLEHGNLFKGGAAILADSQNGDIIVLSTTKSSRGSHSSQPLNLCDLNIYHLCMADSLYSSSYICSQRLYQSVNT
jgi:hypothetical protein